MRLKLRRIKSRLAVILHKANNIAGGAIQYRTQLLQREHGYVFVLFQPIQGAGCMHRRNRHLVDNSGVCVCYLTRNSGGTAYTVNYAKKQGVNVFNIAENIKL